MDKSESKHKPYQSLGEKLRYMREEAKETLADVSGAVEIDVKQLSSIEHGAERPSEDILLLLISHFNIKEDEAILLFEMAGYEHMTNKSQSLMNDDAGQAQPAVMVLPIDARIVYSDMVHVMVNNYGVIMNFMQGAGPNNQSLAISRIGMSKEHARSVLEVLKKTLDQHEKADAKSTPAKKVRTKSRKTSIKGDVQKKPTVRKKQSQKKPRDNDSAQ